MLLLFREVTILAAQRAVRAWLVVLSFLIYAGILLAAGVLLSPLGMIGQRLPLCPLNLLKLIDLGSFAVVRAADSIGEQLLKIGIAHGFPEKQEKKGTRRARSLPRKAERHNSEGRIGY